MNCHRIKRSGRPASWLHSRFCTECRDSQRADDLLAFGIVQLRKPIHAHAPLNTTLAALNLRSLPENYARIRRQRRRAQTHRAMAATAALSVCGWFTYMNWTPDERPVDTAQPETSGYAAFAAANEALVSGFKGIDTDVNKLIVDKPNVPMTEATHVRDFVRANRRALDLIHADLTLPYHESCPSTLWDMAVQPSPSRLLPTTLRAEAAWKLYRGDQAGTVTESMNLIILGENIEGGGSLMARLIGARSEHFGRQLLWRLLPDMSAEQALRCSRMLEGLRRRHVPFKATVDWERNSGLAVRRVLLSDPLWRWHASRTLFHSEAPALPVAFVLYKDSNRQILKNYVNYMDAVEADLDRPYPQMWDTVAFMEQSHDVVNNFLTPSFAGSRFEEIHSETENALLKTALAIHAYRLENGASPSDLQALCPKYLAEVPKDPFQPGSALRYAPTRKFLSFFDTLPPVGRERAYPPFLLYSVGPDGIDQGGSPIFRGSPGAFRSSASELAPVSGNQGDIVAGINL